MQSRYISQLSEMTMMCGLRGDVAPPNAVMSDQQLPLPLRRHPPIVLLRLSDPNWSGRCLERLPCLAQEPAFPAQRRYTLEQHSPPSKEKPLCTGAKG